MNACAANVRSTLDGFRFLYSQKPELLHPSDRNGIDRRFFNLQDLILTLGEEFDGQPLPEGIKPGVPQQCYENARQLCESVDWALDYYEGYAMKEQLFPIPHAWVVDPLDGTVIDNTWERPETVTYVGVRIDRDVVYDQMKRTGFNSIFESDWMADNYMLLTGWTELTRTAELELEVGHG